MSLLRALLAFVAAFQIGSAARAAVEPDRIDGTPVITALKAADLPANSVNRFWYRAGTNALGQGMFVPVIVVRGAQPGPRFVLTAGIHGDELNGIAVIHRLAAEITPDVLHGTLVMVPGLNTPGLLNATREFTSVPGASAANLNRRMPGKADGDAADRYAAQLWALIRPNADFAVDLHTQSHGTAYVMYAFAANPAARRIAELVRPDIIKLDTGDKGTVENTLVDDGVPAITLELGYPEVFDKVMIDRAVLGLKGLMTTRGMLISALPVSPVEPFIANALTAVRTTHGGFVTLAVGLNDSVAKGQTVATLVDPFGRVLETLVAPVAGRVNSLATNPLREPGDMVVRIVFWSDDPKCKNGC